MAYAPLRKPAPAAAMAKKSSSAAIAARRVRGRIAAVHSNPGMTVAKPLAAPRFPTIKRLFTFCRNQCAYPGCTDEIVRDGTVVGDICHIEGSKDGSARFREGQDPEERHGYENLVLLCKLHHATVDGDKKTYTVNRLKEIKQGHEDEATPMPKALVDAAVSLFVALIDTDSVTAQTIHVGTMNVTAPPKISSDAFEPGQGPLGLLAPELGRVLMHQIYMLDRAVVHFSSASASNAPPPDPWTIFRPFKPSLYPSAPACLELSHGDAALLAEFYGGTQEIDDHVCRWREQKPDWDMNIWNVLMQTIGHNIEAGLQATARFCPFRLYDSKIPILGTFNDRGRKALESMRVIMAVHLERFARTHAAIKLIRECYKGGRLAGDFASALTQLAGGSRSAWMAAVEAGVRSAALPLEVTDVYYNHRLHTRSASPPIASRTPGGSSTNWSARARWRRRRSSALAGSTTSNASSTGWTHSSV